MAKTKKKTIRVDAKSGKTDQVKHSKSLAVSGEVMMDRRMGERCKEEQHKLERRAKVARRRQIDPTTCERDYQAEEIEFMSALDQYKRTNGRMFPTCSEVLEVLRALGYEKRVLVEPALVEL